jgi:type I restriction enzyme R subunit
MVKEHLVLIHAIQDEDYWTDITLPMVDEIRRKLRELVQFIDRKGRPPVYTDLPDPLDKMLVGEVDVPSYQTGFNAGQYKKKVEQIVRDNEHHVAIAKVKKNLALTPMDLEALEAMVFDPETVGTEKQFRMVFGKDKGLPQFIREIVGLDRAAAKVAFSKYVAGGSFRADQVRFVETIIDHLTKNGVMDPGLLWEPPFNDEHPDGVEGAFDDYEVDSIIAIVRGFNAGVGVRFGEVG